MSKATLIIPTLERPQILLDVLRSLEEQTCQSFETIVIDQSQTPNQDAAELCKASQRPMRYVHETRQSLPNARNIGARLAASDILIYIDDDVTLEPEFIEAHLKHFDDQGLAAVAGRITGAYDSGPEGAIPVGAFHPWSATVTRNFHTTDPLDSIEQLPGGNFSVRKSIYHEVGGFHPEVFGGPASIGEESDFACRLREHGYRIAFEPRASLDHMRAPRGGCRDDSKTRWTYWHGHNMAVLSRRHCPWYTWLPFLWLQCFRYLVHAIKGANPMLWFAGCFGSLSAWMRPLGNTSSPDSAS